MNNIQYLVAIILISVCTSIIYSNHFNNEFHFDDSHTIQNNVYIRSTGNIPLFFKDASTFSNLPQNQSYRPVVSTSLALDYWLGQGYTLFNFHLSSFIILLLQGILMLFLFIKIFETTTGIRNNSIPIYCPAGLAVALYMFHPANAETINYIIARSDLQSTFFVVLAFVMYIYSSFCRKTFLYLLPVVAGALAKPTAIMFAPLFLFYIILFEEKVSLYSLFKRTHFTTLRKTCIKTLPAFILCALLYVFINKMTPATWSSGGSSVIRYLISQPFVVTHYFGIFFIPAGLSADTDWGLLENIWNIRFFAGMAFIILMTYTAFYCSSKENLRPISYGILWFFISLIPTSSIIPFSEVLNYHRIFFPFIGLAISTCWSLYLLLNKYKEKSYYRSLMYGSGIAFLYALIFYGHATYERNKVWRTEETLWYDVTVKSPENGRGLMNYGLVKMASGDYATAEKYFNRALPILPTYSSLYINIGILKNAQGNISAAESYFKKGLEFGPGYPDSWFFYARFLNSRQRYEEAIPMLKKAIELSPAHMNARSLLMNSYNETSQWDKLNDIVQETLALDPANQNIARFQEAAKNRKTKMEILLDEIKKAPSAESYLNLSVIYYNQGQYQQCIDACNKALLLQPDFDRAYNNICSAYNQLRQWNKAIIAGEKGLELNPSNTLLKNNLQASRQNKNSAKEF